MAGWGRDGSCGGGDGNRSKWHSIRPSWNSVVAAAIAASLDIVCVCMRVCMDVLVCVNNFCFRPCQIPDFLH